MKKYGEIVMDMEIEIEISELVGKTFVAVDNVSGDKLQFTLKDGSGYVFYHVNDCCEDVRIEDVCGDLNDLEGATLLQAEVEESKKDPPGYEPEPYRDSWTWTFYKFATAKGSVTVRWLGESNGYYSESVGLYRKKRI